MDFDIFCSHRHKLRRENIPTCYCIFRCTCTAAAVIASVILGVVTAFLQITGIITVTPVFLWVTLSIATGYWGILLAVGINATSVVSAVLVGLVVLFAALTVTGAACLIRCAADCEG